MIAEYKRDMNHSYLILTGEKEVDTTTYPVRMLLGNTVPALLKCHLQGLNGKSLFYYEITSRQSLSSFYENRLLGTEDLRFILGCLLQTMEKLEEYLLDPVQLVLDPDYIFVDLEKSELRFCYLPGYDRAMDEQFRMLVEYLLPKLDHGDPQAVSLGYGIYRKALEDHFQSESIQKELYTEREGEKPGREEEGNPPLSGKETAGGEPEDRSSRKTEPGNLDLWEKDLFGKEDFLREEGSGILPEKGSHLRDRSARQEQKGQKDKRKNDKRRTQLLVSLCGCALAVATILVILIAVQLGYLPQIHVEKILMGVLMGFGAGIAAYLIISGLTGIKTEKDIPDKNLKQETRHRDPSEEKIWDREEHFEEQAAKKQEEPVFRKGNDWKEEAGDCHETVILSMGKTQGPASLVSREPGELATIYLKEELTVIGKMKTAADAVVPLPTVSRLHAKIRKKDDEYYLTDLNSRNGTAVNGRMLHGEEEYRLQDEDEVDFAQARYIFLK